MLLYKYRSNTPLEQTLDILNNERLFCSLYYRLNDPFEGLFDLATTYPGAGGEVKAYIESDISDLQELGMQDGDEWKPVRVCSLSSDPTDVRLWGHYGGSCRGVAIEIELDDKVAHQVTYDTTLFRHEDDHSYPSIVDVLTRKTSHWAYENEYRIITANEFWRVGGRIRRVIAGPLCAKDTIQIMQKICSGTVPVVRARLNRTAVKIEV